MNLRKTLNRIVYGKYKIRFARKIFTVKQPSIELKYHVDELCEELRERTKFNDWFSPTDCIICLLRRGLLSVSYQQEIKNLEKSIEEQKLSLYNSYFNEKKQKSLRRSIRTLEDKLVKLNNKVHSLDNFTLDGFLETYRYEYLLANCIYCDDKSIDVNAVGKFNALFQCIVRDYIDVQQYRKLANSSMWRDKWYVIKDNPFPLFNYYTDEQQHLLRFTKMYDSVYEHHECPLDVIIDDNDALDGWFIYQKRQREKEKKDNVADKLTSKYPDAQEIFVVADSQQDRERIEELNSPQTMGIKKQREKLLQDKSLAHDRDFLDRQLDIKQQMHQALKSARRK